MVTLGVMVAGCSSGPPPKLYLLEPVRDLAAEPALSGIGAIGLGKVSLPAYADDERIATRVDGTQVRIDDRERWAERPVDALSRLIAGQLGATTDATVLAEPFPRGFDPEYRVEVIFDRLLREASGGVEMSGHVNIIAGDGRQVLRVMPFQQTQFSQSDDFAAFFQAVSSGINVLTGRITEALSVLKRNA